MQTNAQSQQKIERRESCLSSLTHRCTGMDRERDVPLCWLLHRLRTEAERQTLINQRQWGWSQRTVTVTLSRPQASTYLLQELAELAAFGISGAQVLLGSHHGADAASVCVLSGAVHLPALLWPDGLQSHESAKLALVGFFSQVANGTCCSGNADKGPFAVAFPLFFLLCCSNNYSSPSVSYFSLPPPRDTV